MNKWWRGPRQIRLVFLAVMILLASTLGCVTWWLLRQDQQLATQRLVERQDSAADLAVAALDRRLSGIEQDLERLLADPEWRAAAPAKGAVLVRFQGNAMRSWPTDGLVYYPPLSTTAEISDAPFAEADSLEFQKRDYAGAVAALKDLVNSRDSRVRAAALARLARNYRKAGRPQQALAAARKLADLGAVDVAGMPASLAGNLSSLYVFEQQKDQDSLLSAARALESDLESAKWKLSAAAYGSVSKEIRRLLGDDEPRDQSRATIAEGAEWLWNRWNADRSALAGDRQSRVLSTGRVLVLWKSSKDAAAGFIANLEYLETEWLGELAPRLEGGRLRLVLTDLEGRQVLGALPEAGTRPAIRLVSQTGLPWTIQVYSAGNAAGEFASRRNLLILGMAVLGVLILTGTWFIGRAVTRELAVAQLQTDFVSTVSHEFRTPLTTLCQLSELLKRDRVANDDDRRQYYEFLYTESNRLRRLVEALLNFGRLQAGRLQFHFEAVDAAMFIRQSAEEFVEAQQNHGHRVEIETPDAVMVRADRETLRCVFWNLFENATKYSPGCDTVWVNLHRRGPNVEIEVKDRGVGIPRSEHRRIFEKFVRGASAKESNVSGTGIGLAMARQIVLAHGGDITLESEPGKGSTFRVVLPELQGQV